MEKQNLSLMGFYAQCHNCVGGRIWAKPLAMKWSQRIIFALTVPYALYYIGTCYTFWIFLELNEYENSLVHICQIILLQCCYCYSYFYKVISMNDVHHSPKRPLTFNFRRHNYMVICKVPWHLKWLSYICFEKFKCV